MGPSMDLTDPLNSDLSEVLFVRLGPSADLTDPWNSDFSEGLFVCHKDRKMSLTCPGPNYTLDGLCVSLHLLKV